MGIESDLKNAFGNARLYYEEVRGVRIINKFYDYYNFNSSTHRSFKNEVLTLAGKMIPGNPFKVIY